MSTEQRGGRPKIDTEAVRGMVRARISDMERHGENPGAILRGTIPGLCDEVDYLRAEVERLQAELAIWKPKKPVCSNCGARVFHASEHLRGGLKPGWYCPGKENADFSASRGDDNKELEKR